MIIAKLRFSVPSSPIEKTTQSYLESLNRNSFMEISLPDASLRLIQASGRLIRTETDKGRITIFDNRLVTKFYELNKHYDGTLIQVYQFYLLSNVS